MKLARKSVKFLGLTVLLIWVAWILQSCVGSSVPHNPMRKKPKAAPVTSATAAVVDTRGIAVVNSKTLLLKHLGIDTDEHTIEKHFFTAPLTPREKLMMKALEEVLKELKKLIEKEEREQKNSYDRSI